MGKPQGEERPEQKKAYDETDQRRGREGVGKNGMKHPAPKDLLGEWECRKVHPAIPSSIPSSQGYYQDHLLPPAGQISSSTKATTKAAS